MDDLISRQAAILGLMKEAKADGAYGYLDAKTACDVIKELPTAEPEIIRCKDCKYVTRWRSKESARKFGQIYECKRGVFIVPKPDDFCSYAERRSDG